MTDYMDVEFSKLHEYELGILKNVAAVCDRMGLKYYLAEGTLLGAIRHHGFIPWDDDIDICMPRDDYETFLSNAQQELPNHIIIYTAKITKGSGKNDQMGQLFTKVMDDRYKVICDLEAEIPKHRKVFIDLFPIDGIPENVLLQKIHFMRIFVRWEIFRCTMWKRIKRDRKISWWKKAGLTVAAVLRMDRLNSQKIASWYDRLLLKYSFRESGLTINFSSAYKQKTIFPPDYYGEGRVASFEGFLFRIPNETEKILKSEYGDYMTPPPMKERKSKHNIKLIEK